jgi:hypothetical protein
MFLSKDATYCEDVNNLFCVLSWNVRCDREMRFQIFSFAKVFLWIRSRDHAWSSHRLCFDCLTRVFSRWLMLDKNDSSDFDESDSSNMNVISSNLINDVSSNFDERYLIKLDDISSNLMTISHQTRRKFRLFLSDERFWTTNESLWVRFNLLCEDVDRWI